MDGLFLWSVIVLTLAFSERKLSRAVIVLDTFQIGSCAETGHTVTVTTVRNTAVYATLQLY